MYLFNEPIKIIHQNVDEPFSLILYTSHVAFITAHVQLMRLTRTVYVFTSLYCDFTILPLFIHGSISAS